MHLLFAIFLVTLKSNATGKEVLEIELRFQYTKKEHIDSRRKYLFMSKAITKLSLIAIPVLLIIEINLLIREDYPSAIFLGVLYILHIIILLCLYFLQPVMIYNQTEKFHHEYLLTFVDDIILFKTHGINSELKWDIYHQLWETDKYFYLIQARDIYTLLPKRVFTNKEQEKEFVNLYLQQHSKDTYKIFQ